ncbi:MAG: molybdate ABC transporter substrate-binding protein [Caldilineaceae bacterium]
MVRKLRNLWFLLALSLVVMGCAPIAPAPSASAPAASSTTLTVFAAASLTDAFTEIGNNFSAANPGIEFTFNYAGSQQLAQQLSQGADADVFASANGKQMQVAIDAGRIVSGTQHTFTRNRLVAIVPKDNPAQIAALQDLAKPGVKLVLAAKEVPVGQYALDFLDKAEKDGSLGAGYKDAVIANTVSYEENVKAVLTKVVLGEADAGIVYSSDVTVDASEKVTRIDIPDALNTLASYPIAVVSNSAHPDEAQKFVDYVFSPDGQTVLVKYGFISTTGSASGAAPAAVPVEISGLVDKPLTLSGDDLKAMEQIEIKATDRDGKEQSYTGVSLNAVLAQAGLKAEAKSAVFTGGDGYAQELTLAEISADANAVLVVDEGGGIRNILPSTKPKFWVKGLVKIEVK